MIGMAGFSHWRTMDRSDLEWVTAAERHAQPVPWSRAVLESSWRHHLGLVMCAAAGAPRGYAFVQRAGTELELLNFVVLPAWQGQGIGRAALNALLRRFDDGRFEQMFLEVRRSNQPAIRLYRGAGFNEIGVRPDYYRLPDGRREDALLMAYVFERGPTFQRQL